MGMRHVVWLLAGVLAYGGWGWAAEYQPTPQDWQELQSKATATLADYQRLTQRTQDSLKAMTGTTPRMHTGDGRDEFYTAEMLTSLLQSESKTQEELTAAVKAMQQVDLTRARYIELLRTIKHGQNQYLLDEERYYQPWKSAAQADVMSTAIADLHQAAATPPTGFSPQPLPAKLRLSWLDFPRIDGSTTAQPLSTLIACRVLGLGAEWHTRDISDLRNAEGTRERVLVPVAGERPHLDDFKWNYSSFTNPGLRMNMVHTGTHTAYDNLIAGVSNFIIVARPPSATERELAKAKGVELDARPIGYDAFIFLLNSKNPLSSLTSKQLQDIYQDNVLSWSEVGGDNSRVIALQREPDSGSQESMDSLVMHGLPISAPGERMMVFGMGGPYTQLRLPNAIGYSFYYYHTYQYHETPPLAGELVTDPAHHQTTGIPPITAPKWEPMVKICAVNGILPSPATIRDRTYPYVTAVYAVVRKDADGHSSAVRLRDWLLTPAGQAVVVESGYVPAR